jgi:hypothetical protein
MSEPAPARGDKGTAGDFERQAVRAEPGLARELLDFLRDSRKWWLGPILLALLVIGVMVVLAETAAAPFIYSLF